MGQKVWQITIAARDGVALSRVIKKAREGFGLPCDCPVFSCYEAGREGFWLHRLLTQPVGLRRRVEVEVARHSFVHR
jgi:hypothetical protein